VSDVRGNNEGIQGVVSDLEGQVRDAVIEGCVRDAVFERVPDEEIQTDLGAVFRAAAKAGLELVLEEVLREVVGVSKWAKAKTRNDSYNGSYLRGLLTSMGHIEIKMPRARKAGAPVGVIGAYKRRSAEVDEAIVSAYVKGVSTRGVGSVVEALAGNSLSSSAVSRVTTRLEEKVEELRTRKLEGKYPYLFLDATYLKARWARSVESVPVLIAYGVNEAGKRELLAVEVGTEESGIVWGRLLGGLIKRGLQGVMLVISDDHEGIKAAAREHLPEVPHQRCVFHLNRNVGSHVTRRLRKRVQGEVSAIFKSKDLDQAKSRLAKFKDRWTKELPEAVKCLKEGFPAASRFFAFPAEHYPRIRTNNGLERLNREIKRRTKAIDSFPDRESAVRLVVAVAANAAQAWERRRYVDTSLLDL